jgi:hypothetical protein
MGQSPFEAARAEGRAMALEDWDGAVAHALEP